jgi:DNA-binding protein HU-beta
MTKTELVAKVAEKAGITKKDADKAANAVIDAVVESLQAGEKVQLVGFGTFEVHHREARKGRNPRTKEELTIPASSYPVFKAGKAFKDAVSK